MQSDECEGANDSGRPRGGEVGGWVMAVNLGRARRWSRRGTLEERIERTATRLSARGLSDLSASIAAVETHAPLPRCEHGSPLRDGAGEFLEPLCGCSALPAKPGGVKP